jgi:hypothetical protein
MAIVASWREAADCDQNSYVTSKFDTEIFIMDLDGAGATQVTNTIGMDGSPRPGRAAGHAVAQRGPGEAGVRVAVYR